MRRAGLTDISAFLAVAEHRSFRKAAAALGVSPSALSHAMKNLEHRVGVRLLNRTTRSVVVSDAGRALLERVGPAMDTIDQAITDVAEQGDRVSGRIRISAPEVGAKILLNSTVPWFARHHPAVTVEIEVDDGFVDIVAGGFDAGVRLYEAVPQDMIAVPIAPAVALVAVAAPSYLDSHGAPTTPSELLDHRCVRFRRASGSIYRWEFQKDGQPAIIDVRGPLVLNNMNAVVEAALQGVGICLAWSYLVDDHVASGRLTRLLEDWSPAFPGPHLYYPSRKHQPKAFGLFVDHFRSAV